MGPKYRVYDVYIVKTFRMGAVVQKVVLRNSNLTFMVPHYQHCLILATHFRLNTNLLVFNLVNLILGLGILFLHSWSGMHEVELLLFRTSAIAIHLHLPYQYPSWNSSMIKRVQSLCPRHTCMASLFEH